MGPIVECVPNFSDGRRAWVLEDIADAARSVRGVSFLGYEADQDHNRCVMTFIGAPEPVKEAAFRSSARAAQLIDMNNHRGEHPRMGAADVIPFVPVREVSMADCIAMARDVGRRIGEELRIPVFLYQEAANDQRRQDLAWVRKGEFEGLRESIGKDPDRNPDFGPARIHPTAGATAVGARFFLVAFNVNLRTPDVKVAKSIAKKVRESSGGLPKVKALGMELHAKGMTQVSMNLTDYRVTSPVRVLEEIRALAAAAGVEVAGSEIIGFVPAEALILSAAEALKAEGFQADQVLENRIEGAIS
jgi:glutamate formiminotransferase